MKKILLFIVLIVTSIAQSQIIDFSDENLKNALLDHNPIIDTNANGEIDVSEAMDYNEPLGLNLRSKEITNISGLENFINTEVFNLGFNEITDIDISVLPWARNISLNNNELSTIDVSSNLLLEELRIGSNNLTTIDLTNNENLITLSVTFTPLTTLDVSNNILLEELRIDFTEISTIDLSANNLKTISLGGTDFSSFEDFNTQFELERIDASFTSISVLDTDIFLNLEILDIRTTEIETIDLSQNILLEQLSIGSSNLIDIDISNNSILEVLIIENGLSSIDVSQNTNLQALLLLSTNISSLDLSFNDQLCIAYVNNNEVLEYINVKNGNNSNFGLNGVCDFSLGGEIGFSVSNAPNLEAICVDDVDFALGNFEIPVGITLLDSCPGNLGETNQLIGFVSYDENNDGCDPDDQPVSVLISSTDGVTDFATISSPMGDFNLQVFEGEYDTQILGIPDYFTTTPDSHQNSFTGFNQTENIDFCISSTTVVNDLSVTLIPISQARPGFNADYQIVYRNMGTTTLSGTVNFNFNETLFDFEQYSPVPTNITTSTISWDFENLHPFTYSTINITLGIEQPPIVEGDDILQYIVSITPNDNDTTPNDNTFELNQIVVNSFDPNDKTCLEGEEVSIENEDDYLHYLVRFQNTGTASAINIRVVDVLDEKLDWTSLIVESLSHDGRIEIDNERTVSFIFDNINLPHEAADSEGSNGYIAYKIKPLIDQIEIGSVIENTAHIFFDFNAPIITNTVSTTFVEPLAVDEFNTLELSVYPNPTQGVLQINSDLLLQNITILNALGQTIKTLTINNTTATMDLSGLKNGLYFLKISTINGETEIQRVLKK